MKTVTAIRKLRFTEVEATKYEHMGLGATHSLSQLAKLNARDTSPRHKLAKRQKGWNQSHRPHSPETKKGRDGHPTMQWSLVRQALTNRRMTPWRAH